MPSSHLVHCHPLLLLPPIPPSIRVFSNESTLRMRWPKYWSFSLSISPSNEHAGLISFIFLNLFLFIYFGGYLLYNIVLVLPYINMNSPQVYTCSPSWTPLLPPSLYHPSGSSQNGLVGSPCSPRDSQVSSPTPQFKSISSVLSFLHSPTLTSIHDHWKNCILD